MSHVSSRGCQGVSLSCVADGTALRGPSGASFISHHWQLMHVGRLVVRRKRCSSIPYSFKRVCAQERSLGLVSNPSLWDKSDKDTRFSSSAVESVLPQVFRRSRIWRLQLGYCPKNGQGHGSDSDRFSIDPSPTPDRDQGNWVYSQSLQMIAAQVVITPLPWVMG